MLTYTAIGPTATGDHLVVYPTPGCTVPTVACMCRTHAQALDAASRLNSDQAIREKALQDHLALLARRRNVDTEAKADE